MITSEAAEGRQRIAVLGATGSIGTQALAVIDNFPHRFELFAAVSGRQRCDRPARYVLTGQSPDFEARLEEIVTHPECDTVLVAIPGAASLRPTLAALEAGKRVALASKEVLVMAGDLVMARASQDQLLPVDSEHSALWQCMWGEARENVARLLLTASGGPFWGSPDLNWEKVSVAQALAHPRWSMGPKVSIDSATMVNKALELIEAHYLFQVPLEQIEVVIHPQSVIHSMVEFIDGSSKAQLGNPDMRLPIGLALAYPRRLPGLVPSTIFNQLEALEMFPLDGRRFPAVDLARNAALLGPPYPAIFNAADEEAVTAFLNHRLPFSGIVRLIDSALAAYPGASSPSATCSLGEILEADQWARDHVRARI
ncbi:MAG: 1-deoxy-D-xylulose-5-phosphate reductoisomerase [Candidatus Dormibacteraceae bacterium]